MKVAISSTGKDFNAQIDPRFGRCAHLAIVDTATMEIQVFDNENIDLTSGAGIQTAGFAASKKIEAVLTGNCGPKAMQVFTEAGIKVYTGQTGTVKEAVERLKNDLIDPVTEANVPEKQGFQSQSNPGMGAGGGMGRCGGGMGRCGGGGRGMGGGGGRGVGGGGGRGMGGGGGMGMGGGGRRQ